MVTNIIRNHLIAYTQDQCRLWGIPLQQDVPSGPIWRRDLRAWDEYHAEMLVLDGRKLLLVPKAIVSRSDPYTANQYHQHHVPNFLQNEHLRMNTVLVKERRDRRGRVTNRYVTKKSIRQHDDSALRGDRDG